MKFIKLAVTILMMAVASGCTTLADSIAAKGTGPSRIYHSPKEEVWPIVIDAVRFSGLDLVSESKDSGMILAQRGISAFSYGENVAVFVDEKTDSSCRVEIISKRAMETNVFAPDWSNKIFTNLDSRLN
jgi:hypothetical protein